MLQMMQENKSTDQWTALYFWLMSITSNSGKHPFMATLFSAMLFYVSLIALIGVLPTKSTKPKNILYFFTLTPFVGVFAFTLGHDVTATSGIFLQLRILFKGSFQIGKKESVIAFLGVFFACTSIIGFAASIGFLIIIFARRHLYLGGVLLVMSTLLVAVGPNIFSIERTDSNLGLGAVLGDIKCIAQHPESRIRESDWKTLEILAPRHKWIEPSTCAIADYAFFALEPSSRFKPDVLKVWLSMVKDNPQIFLMARIQRASVALPPLFFRAPPNMFDTRYENPVGLNSSTDLQIAPDLFKSSVDLNYTKRLPGQKIVESVTLLPAFMFNQRSDLWGWGGCG